jgi:uracil-DNA glycosylase
MRIFFVGLHNKPGKKPLCSSTKSGKLIDRIINEGGFKKCEKTNLFDVEYYPKSDDENWGRAVMWWHNHKKISDKDIIVLLGSTVQKDFVNPPLHERIVKIDHPASKWSKNAMNEYVSDAITKIKNY